MAKNDKNIIKSNAEYTRSYENLRGVSFTEGGSDETERYGYLENMYVDYESGAECVESIPGFRKILSLGQKIHGIYDEPTGDGEHFITVHAGDKLYRFNLAERDTLSGLTSISDIADEKSHAFSYAKELYIISGGEMIKIDSSGEAKKLNDKLSPYVPTTYKNGVAHETRSLLTDEYRQSYVITDHEAITHGTASLNYRITDLQQRKCSVTGIASSFSGGVYIPSYTTVEGVRCKVTEIDDGAFLNNRRIESVTVSHNLERVGDLAFGNCTSLHSVTLPDSIRVIGYRAFFGCSALTRLYVGLAISEIGRDALSGAKLLSSIYYAGDAERLKDADKENSIGSITIALSEKNNITRLSIPVLGNVGSVDWVRVDGVPVLSTYLSDTAELCIDYADKHDSYGNVVEFGGRLINEGGIFDEGVEIEDLILGCTVSAVYDKRVFLSGNPRLPGYVFYSGGGGEDSNSPLYFSERGYFKDGAGNYDVLALLPANGSLYVLKSGDDGSGSIFCHTKDTSSRTVEYPTTYSHGGIAISGAAHTLLDDALFLTSLGVSALEKVSGSDYRRVVNRSGNINSELLGEELSRAIFTEWRGYLVLLIGDKIYLGDSRDKFTREGSFEYEWYRLSGIGTHVGDSRVYRYSSVATSDLALTKGTDDEIAEGVIMSRALSDGRMLYFVKEGDECYEVYTEGEFRGGELSPPSAIIGVGDILIFGTECGDVCVFNNDKRGEAKEQLEVGEGYAPIEYRKILGGGIHPAFYSFAGHTPRYALKTKRDTVSLPYLRKDTVRSSTVLKFKSFPGSAATIEVITDSTGAVTLGRLPLGYLSFDEMDFSTFSASTEDFPSIPLNDLTSGWVEKEIAIYTDDFSSPIGVYSLNYRYRIKGRICSEK